MLAPSCANLHFAPYEQVPVVENSRQAFFFLRADVHLSNFFRQVPSSLRDFQTEMGELWANYDTILISKGMDEEGN